MQTLGACPRPRCGPDQASCVKSEVVGWKIDGCTHGIWPGIALRALSDASAIKAGKSLDDKLSLEAIRVAQAGEPKF